MSHRDDEEKKEGPSYEENDDEDMYVRATGRNWKNYAPLVLVFLLGVISLAFIVPLAKFAFAGSNPDLKANNGEHHTCTTKDPVLSIID